MSATELAAQFINDHVAAFTHSMRVENVEEAIDLVAIAFPIGPIRADPDDVL